MPKLIFACIFLAALFCLLCGPSLYVGIRLRRRGDMGALPALRALWLAQVILTSGVIFAADAMGLKNPAGYVLAAILGVGCGGAVLFGLWRLVFKAPGIR